MKVIKSLADIGIKNKKISLMLGNFDGVHRGHQYMIREAHKASENKDSILVLATYKHHTLKILDPHNKKYILSSALQKQEELERLGIPYLYEIDFTQDVQQMTGPEFLNKYFFSYNYSFLDFYIGKDFKMGKQGKWTFENLKTEVQDKISFQIIDPEKHDNLKISSSHIRSFLNEGNIEQANILLGRSFTYEGEVIDGAKRGSKIGFPTANLKIDCNYIFIKPGVYISHVQLVDGRIYKSVTNIGHNPTFENASSPIKIETHILGGFSRKIYGETIKLSFCKRLRDEIKFSSVEQLVSQIKLDIVSAEKFFRNEND